MIIAIIGGRDFDDYNLLKNTLKPLKHKIDQIVSGAAPGADSLGARWCREFLHKEPIEYPAEWTNLDVKPCRIKRRADGTLYNSLAGFNRNKLIIKKCDACVAFWNGKSTGTGNSIDLCKKYNKPKMIIYY